MWTYQNQELVVPQVLPVTDKAPLAASERLDLGNALGLAQGVSGLFYFCVDSCQSQGWNIHQKLRMYTVRLVSFN